MPWQERLVIVLTHFVWQGAAVSSVLAMAVAVLRLRRPNARYAASLVALGAMTICPLVTWQLVTDDAGRQPVENSPQDALVTPPKLAGASAESPQPGSGVRFSDLADSGPTSPSELSSAKSENRTPDPSRSSAGTDRPAMPTNGSAWQRWLKPFEPWIVGAWLAGVGVLSLRLLLGAVGTWRWRRDVLALSDDLAERVTRLCAALSMRVPRVRISRRVTEAIAVGLWRPMILLPAAWVTELPLDMLEAVLAHELAHLRRLDLWINLWQRIVETLLFYHPAVWWLSRRLRIERELCCDDLAAAVTHDRLRYAETLEHVALLTRRVPVPGLAVAMSSREGVLLCRVRQLLGVAHPPTTRGAWFAGLLTIGLVLTMAFGTFVSSRGESAKRNDQYIAKLPGDIEVELVGVGFLPYQDHEWWKADGSKLAQRPKRKGQSNVLTSSRPDAADWRGFMIEIRGLSPGASVRTDPGPVTISSTSNSSFDELFVSETAAGPFKSKTTSIRVGLTADPFRPATVIDANGRKRAAGDPPDELKPLDDRIVPLGVDESERQVELLLAGPPLNELSKLAYWSLHAIDVDGKKHGSSSESGTPGETRVAFNLPRSRLSRFEYRLRPYRHWVTFENVSLQPGELTDVNVKIDSPADAADAQNAADPDRNDARVSYARKLADVAKAEYDVALETNRRVPGTVPKVEVRRLAAKLELLELEVQKGERRVKGEDVTDLEVKSLRTQHDVAKAVYDECVEANQKMPFSLPDPMVNQYRLQWEKAGVDLAVAAVRLNRVKQRSFKFEPRDGRPMSVRSEPVPDTVPARQRTEIGGGVKFTLTQKDGLRWVVTADSVTAFSAAAFRAAGGTLKETKPSNNAFVFELQFTGHIKLHGKATRGGRDDESTLQADSLKLDFVRNELRAENAELHSEQGRLQAESIVVDFATGMKILPKDARAGHETSDTAPNPIEGLRSGTRPPSTEPSPSNETGNPRPTQSSIERDHAKVVKTLDRVVPFECVDLPLHKVLDQFIGAVWVPIQLDPQSHEVMQTRITFKSQADEFEYVLAAVLDQAKLTYCVHSVWLVVGSPAEIRGRGYAVPESFSELVAKLRKADESIRWEAILRGTVEAADLDAMPRVLKLLDHADAVVQREALRMLFRFGERARSAQAAALTLTESRDAGVRRVAWRAFAATRGNDTSTLPLIVQAWNDGNEDVRRDFFPLMALFGDGGNKYLTAYHNGSAEFRQFLMRSIGDPDASQHDLVMLGLSDEHPPTRAAALKYGLQRTTYSEPIVRKLRHMLDDTDPLCRVLAAGHLLKLPDDVSAAATVLVREASANNVQPDVTQESLAAFEFLSLETGQRARELLQDTLRTTSSDTSKGFCREALATNARRQVQIQSSRQRSQTR